MLKGYLVRVRAHARDTYVASSRESSHEYRVETTGASPEVSWNPGFADNPTAFRSWRDVKRHCGERKRETMETKWRDEQETGA